MQTYTNAVKLEIIRAIKFKLHPPLHATHEIAMLQDGSVAGSFLIDRWDIKPVGKAAKMFVYQKEKLVAILSFDSKGAFIGRERESNGVLKIDTTIGSPSHWRTLSDPIRYYVANPTKVEIQSMSTKTKPTNGAVPSMTFSPVPQIADWGRYEYDLSEIINTDALPKSDTAIILIGCDRPSYFQQVAESLAKNKESHEMPIFFFIDKPISESKQATIVEQEMLCRKLFPNCVIIHRQRNYGCGRSIIDARHQIFTNLGYDYAFVIEDDLVLSPQYLGLCKRLMKWAEENYDNIGAVQLWKHCSFSRSIKESLLNRVEVTYTNWWAYLMKREVWSNMEPLVMEYQKLFLGGPYSERPYNPIINWFDLQHANNDPLQFKKPYPDSPYIESAWDRYNSDPPSGQDGVTMQLLEMLGYKRLTTTVNRGLYIGKQGIHMSPTRYVQHGYQNVDLDIFEEDLEIDSFALKTEIVEVTQ